MFRKTNQPARVGNRWVFPNGRSLPVVSGGDGPDYNERLTTLDTELRYVEAELVSLSEEAGTDPLNEDQQTRWDEGTAFVTTTEATIVDLQARARMVERAANRQDTPAEFQIRRPTDTGPNLRTASTGEIRAAAAKLIDQASWLTPDQQESAERVATQSTPDRDATEVARATVATSTDAYQRAFMKGVAGNESLMTDEERAAVVEARAMSSTTTAGGFGVPVLIDPTVLITDGTGLLSILPYCRIEPVTTDAWKGVSAGHTAWSFDVEGVEVSDDASTFAQPEVSVHEARGFIPFSMRIEEDYPGFASEMNRLLTDGYVDLLAEKIAVGAGDGSVEPWGIFATTTTTVDVTTDNTFGAPDIDATWAALGERFRGRATWFMNVDVENDIRGFGSGTATSRFTVDQTSAGISLLNGRPVVLSDWAPTWTGTDAAKILTLADFDNFVIAQRVGMRVEYVPHLFSTTTNLPNGQRGWFAYARVGSDLAVQNAARVLKNQTT